MRVGVVIFALLLAIVLVTREAVQAKPAQQIATATSTTRAPGATAAAPPERLATPVFTAVSQITPSATTSVARQPAVATPTAAPASAPAKASSKDLTRSDQGAGSVTVMAVLLTAPAAGFDPSTEIGFSVSFDTHSVELGVYDLAKSIILRDSAGTEYTASTWTGGPGGGHHRSGLVIFAKNNDQGQPIISKDTRSVELVVKNVSGVKERVLRWDNPAQLSAS